MEPGARSARGRIAIAVGAAAALLVIVAVVALAGGGGEEPRAEPPRECVRAWNSDPDAVAFGRHNYFGHGYQGALVTYLNDDAEEVDSAELGSCAVIFPAEALDPEPIAAGEVLRAGTWTPISELEGIELSRVGELQVLAAGAPNTGLMDTGKLAGP